MKEFPAGRLSRDEAQLLMPPSFKVYVDLVNGRWQCYNDKRAFSRSLSLHGYEGACKQVVAAAWQHFLFQGGFLMTECPIAGLLQPTAGAAGAAGAASASST